MVNFLFELTEFFRYLLQFQSCVYSSAVFSGGSTSLHTNFTWTGSSPINHSWEN